MTGNAIHTIPRKLFQHLRKFDFIELQVNRIQIFDPYIFNHLSTRVQLFIQRNPIVCDCQALPLLKWLSVSQTSVIHFPTCQSPESLQNQSIYYARLPQDCPHSTQTPVSFSVLPTVHFYPSRDQITPIFISGAVIAALMCICPMLLCAVCRSSHEDSE
ncbi:Leucine-rich repeat transmembrane protein FLRT2 [Holothuria leucospilota]|uniref:Leucine-rich repeat transmembrane protein FLRT2 n=1 Tax=Holothuria leucospilota TaxID=206669 RepID=A0A9Q1CHY7_HOLLE|nr:Leucine-rich repeat transmembrane protein FLRT2 [Holothuria leucospilota]